MPTKTSEGLKLEIALLEFYRKASLRLRKKNSKTIEKCEDFYRNIHQVHEKYQIPLVPKIIDLPRKDEHVTHLQEILEEDIQYIQKIEVFNKEDINLSVGQDFVNTHILGDMCKYATEKVTRVQTHLEVHKVTVQVLEPIKYKTIAKEFSTWAAYVSSRARRT